MTDIEAGLDDDLQLALDGVLLGRGGEEFSSRQRLQLGQAAQLLADLGDARRDQLAIHRSSQCAGRGTQLKRHSGEELST